MAFLKYFVLKIQTISLQQTVNIRALYTLPSPSIPNLGKKNEITNRTQKSP
jgi:hypothetical protein